jgi:ATP-dependent helicase/nuclease subunit B
VPSIQRAHAVRLAFAAAALDEGRRVFASPDVRTDLVWLRAEAERRADEESSAWPRLLKPAEEWFLWRQSAAEVARSLALLNGSALAESLQRSSELAAQFRITPAGHGFGSESAILRDAQHAFAERCQALGATSLHAILGQLAERGGAAARGVVLRGFDTVTPALAAIVGTRSAEAAEPPGPAAEPRVLRAGDTREELERIAGWCRERLSAKSDARLLVVLPGLAGGRERLAALIRQALDPASTLRTRHDSTRVGIEGGQPLAQRPMIAQALATLGWLGGVEADYDALSRWLRAPYWTRPPAALRARLDVRLRERPMPRLGLREFLGALGLAPADLQPTARELSAQLATAARALGEGSASPRAWSERFAAALSAAGWPGPLAADSAGQQTLLRWRELFDEFRDLTGGAGSLPLEEALRVLHELAARTAYRPADEDPSVIVSPALADPVVRYDGIWVAGLHAEAFPQPPQPDPFLALAAQVAAGVPSASAAGRLAQARTQLAAWRRSADELILSAPAHAEDLELLPSLLLEGAAPEPLALRSVWLPARLQREGLTESLVDATGRPWTPAQPLPRGTRSLDLQNQCPFRAYAELRLGCTRRERIEPGIAPNRRGELLHAALQALWEQLGDSRSLAGLSDTALDELIARAVEEAVQGTLARPLRTRRAQRRTGGTQLDMFARPPPILERECRRAARLIRRLCETERERTPFSVEATEGELRLRLAGATLHMRVDRVDALESGGRAILDYKTGKRVSGDWYGERPMHPQLLAYAEALGPDVVALATVTVSAREVHFDGLARAPQLLPHVKATSATGAAEAWAERQRAWRAIVTRLIRAFLAGAAAVDPRPGACDYCHVRDVCRILETADV